LSPSRRFQSHLARAMLFCTRGKQPHLRHLPGGSSKLHGGTSKLGGGTSDLSDGSSKLGDGTSKLDAAPSKFRGSPSKMTGRTSKIPAGDARLPHEEHWTATSAACSGLGPGLRQPAETHTCPQSFVTAGEGHMPCMC
jgi:X-X-X-Leu-X-X-Gly heptad repeat protein